MTKSSLIGGAQLIPKRVKEIGGGACFRRQCHKQKKDDLPISFLSGSSSLPSEGSLS